MKKCLVVLWILFFMFSPFAVSQHKNHDFDMRNGLNPARMTIAMWDFSWLYMHHEAGSFENFEKVMDELIARNFNTIRIDAFPLIIGSLDSLNQKVTIPANPQNNWGQTDKNYKHEIVKELIAFLRSAQRKKLNIILSTWNMDCMEFPGIKAKFEDRQKYWAAWEKVLDMLKDNKLIDNIAYVDLDQEFPFFSPFQNRIDSLKFKSSAPEITPDGELVQSRNMEWNNRQMNFVHEHLDSSLIHFQTKYPELRFTFSFTGYWNEVRYMNLKSLDVLELHIWLTQSKRFLSRSQFDNMNKIRNCDTNYSGYMQRVNSAMRAIRPMLIKDMHNRLSFALDWSDEIAAPLVTTEAWGPWWHMDNKFLDWKWLYDWCEECMKLASDYGFWGATPWNFSHPYWDNWKNVKWYKKVNARFLKTN